MADTRGRIGSGGMFLRNHAAEPSRKIALLRQDHDAANLLVTPDAP
jgi:hypothetical protein